MGFQKDTYDSSEWATVYFLAAYGGLFYAATFSSFPVLNHYLKKEAWTPLAVKQRGLTQIGFTAAGFWYLHNMLVSQLPNEARDKVLPPHGFTCYFREFWRTAAICVYANAIMVKQYKNHVRYVSRLRRLPTRVYMLLASIPYILMMSLPFVQRYELTDDGECRHPGSLTAVLLGWTFVVFVTSCFLLNALRDTSTYFPSFQGSVAEVVGLFLVLVSLAFESWVSCDGSKCPTYFTRVTVLTFMLVTVPNAVYWICLGEVMWKVFTGDQAYCIDLERRCSPTTHLITTAANENPTFDEPQHNDSEEDFEVVTVALASRARPNYEKGNTGEFFETDRLARLIDGGEMEEVRSFVLATNLDLIHVLDRDGLAPLHRAVLAGSADLVEFLIEIECDPNLPNKEGERALHFAAKTGHAGLVAILCDAKADVNALSHRGTTPLGCAVVANSLPCVVELLARGAVAGIPKKENVRASDPWERAHVLEAGQAGFKTPLVLAVERGLADITECLVRHAPVNTHCTHGLSPLMNAVVLGHAKPAEILLKNEADVWYINYSSRQNVLHYNAMQGSRLVFELLKEWFFRVEPPSTPPRSPTIESIEDMAESRSSEDNDSECDGTSLARIADLGQSPRSANGGGLDGASALGTAARDVAYSLNGSSADVLQPLWVGPADARQLLVVFLSMPDRLGRTPLHYAVVKGHHELVSVLVAEGSSVDARDLPKPSRGCFGYTPIEYVKHYQGLVQLTPSERGKYCQVAHVLQRATRQNHLQFR